MSIRASIVNRTYIVTVEGKIDVKNMGVFRQTVSDARKADINKLILDFKDLTFIDSSGIGVIINQIIKLNTKVGRIHIINSPGDICRVIALTGISGLVEIHSSMDEIPMDN